MIAGVASSFATRVIEREPLKFEQNWTRDSSETPKITISNFLDKASQVVLIGLVDKKFVKCYAKLSGIETDKINSWTFSNSYFDQMINLRNSTLVVTIYVFDHQTEF